MADQKSQTPTPPKAQTAPPPSTDIPAFQQTTTRLLGLGGTTTEVQYGGRQPSLFGAHRERLEAQLHDARTKPQKASIYANDIAAFKLGNEQERARTGGPSR